MSAIHDFFTAMLSRFMIKHNITCNIRIEGHGEAFISGKGIEAPPFTIVFNGLLAYYIFAASPNLLTMTKLFIDGYVDIEGEWFAFAKIMDKIGDTGPSTTTVENP